MSALLLPVPGLRATDQSGAPLSGALLRFYLSGTTTPTPVYAAADLATPLANPVVSDSAGLFPPIFVNPSIAYRAQLLTHGGSLLQDVDPIAAPFANPPGSVTGAMLAAGAAAANLGYAPLNRAGDTATNLILTNSAPGPYSAGYLGAPVNAQNGGYTFALSDAGAMVRAAASVALAYAIPPNSAVAFPVGAVILVRNAGSAVVTLTRGAGVALTLAGSSTSKDLALAAQGMATLIQEAADHWVATGVGLT